jgi:hypothetical protein
MANDLVGLLTGISGTQQPMQPIAGTPGFAGMFGAQQAQGLASGLGRIARQGAPSNQERMQEAVSKLDLGSVDGLSTFAKLQQIQGDLAGAAQTAAKVKQLQDNKIIAEEKAAEAAVEEKRYQENLELEKRKVAANELKARAAAKPKVYEPKINIGKDGDITVVSTDPATAGTVISRNSTKSEAQQIAEDVVKRQEEENKIRNLVVKRNILSGQADEVRLALKEAEEEASLPLAANLQLQQSSPLYGSLMSGNTYKKLNNAVTSVKSQQALNTIAEMKSQSSTGATGLGATNAMEFIALESAIRALDPLVPSTIEGNLQAIEQNLNNIILINQGKEPKINWDLPVYSHMVYPTTDGGRAYSYDGTTFYKIAETAEQ